MFHLGNSFEYYCDNVNSKIKIQEKMKGIKDDDHQIVLIHPHSESSSSSPTRNSTSTVHVLAKNKLVWCIAILLFIFIILSYQSYVEYLRQIRLLTYMERVDELKLSMQQVKHHIVAATYKLKEIRQIQYSDNTSITLKWNNL